MVDSWTQRETGNTVWSDRETHGTNIGVPVVWTTITRPPTPFNGQTGKNTDFDGLETYNLKTGKWKILNGNWTSATRPSVLLDNGSMGVNADQGMGLELWNGTEWQLL